MADVNVLLREMGAIRTDPIAKGAKGELIALEVLRQYSSVAGGFILHSYQYPYKQKPDGSNYPGNLKYQDGQLITLDGRESTNDEIDLLYISPRRVIPIEVKTRSGKWKLFDHWCRQGDTIVDKSPITQAEKHARHLYHHMYEVLPDGDPNYILPLVLFVDKSTIHDTRSKEFQTYVKVCILNNFKKTLTLMDRPGKNLIDVQYVKEFLARGGTNTGVY